MKRSISWILVIALVLGMLPQNFAIDIGGISEQIIDFLFPSAYAEEIIQPFWLFCSLGG